jgi:hypothetical protein
MKILTQKVTISSNENISQKWIKSCYNTIQIGCFLKLWAKNLKLGCWNIGNFKLVHPPIAEKTVWRSSWIFYQFFYWKNISRNSVKYFFFDFCSVLYNIINNFYKIRKNWFFFLSKKGPKACKCNVSLHFMLSKNV